MTEKLIRILLTLMLVVAVAFAIFWYSRPADVSFDGAKAAVPHAEYSHFADIDGVRIHYQEKGSGPALVLIHGWASSTYTWNDVFDPLAEHFHVVALDLKGFGFSGKPEGDYTRRAQADSVIRLLDHLKIERAMLCGNSMGGDVALNAARYYPQRVTGLILIDSSGIDVEGGSSTAPDIVYWQNYAAHANHLGREGRADFGRSRTALQRRYERLTARDLRELRPHAARRGAGAIRA